MNCTASGVDWKCERDNRAKGLCAGHYQQQRYGNALAPLKSRRPARSVPDGHIYCPGCDRITPKARLTANYCADCLRARDLDKNYGLTRDRFDEILAEQGGCCAICGRDDPGQKGWCVDHDHDRELGSPVRGILCVKCNAGLGMFDDRIDFLESAARYRYTHSHIYTFRAGQ